MFRRTILQKVAALPHGGLAIRSASRPVIPSLFARIRPTLTPLPALPTLRFFSGTPSNAKGNNNNKQKKEETKEKENGGNEGPPQEEVSEFDRVTKELQACMEALTTKTGEVTDLKDKYLRSVADFRNLQERTGREVTAAKSFAIQKFAQDLIESVDHIDLALSAVPKESRESKAEEKKDLVDLYKGLRMTEEVLLNTLKKHGLEKVTPEVGEKFDPNRHEAVFQVPLAEREPGTVMVVQRTGFVLNGRVVRAAQVGVVMAPPS